MRWSSLCAVFVFACAVPAHLAPAADFVPGQCIVRFKPNTDGARAVREISQGSATDLSPLQGTVARLSAVATAPLTATQLASDSSVVLAVDGTRVAERIARELKQRTPLAHLTTTVAPPIGGLMRFPRGVTVRADSAQGAPTVAGVATELAEITERTGVPLAAEAGETHEVVVAIDWQALTQQVVERLKGDDAVQSVELNYLARPQPRTGGDRPR